MSFNMQNLSDYYLQQIFQLPILNDKLYLLLATFWFEQINYQEQWLNMSDIVYLYGKNFKNS